MIPLNTSLCRLDEPANAAKALALTALYWGDIFYLKCAIVQTNLKSYC